MINMINVGFGSASISPDFPVYISGGYYPKRISENTIDELKVICVALTDDAGKTVLLITQDMEESFDHYVNEARELVEKATGVPYDDIYVSSTHTHSAPGVNRKLTGVLQFLELYYKSIVEAAQQAMADRAPAEAYVGNTQAEGMTFVRRYKLADGTYQGARGNFSQCKEIVDHAYPADYTMQLIRWVREGKKDILMCNIGAHATFNGATYKLNVSGDFPVFFREYVEKNSDMHMAYYIAAAGDQTPSSRMKSDDHGLDYRQYGEKLGQIALEALPTLTKVATGKVANTKDTCELATNKRGMDKLEIAREIAKFYSENGFAKGNAMAIEHGFASVYEATSTVMRSALPETMKIGGYAVSAGELGFALAPYEMYSHNGAFIRENGPHAFTFVITMTNVYQGYLPSDMGYEIDCYEAYSARVTRGSGEKLADMFVRMLTDLKEQ